MTAAVDAILARYEGEGPAIKANLARILNHGRLGGTGRVLILPVDQGSEHGPDKSFAVNAAAYDPHYLYRLAVDAGLSAFAAPLGLLQAGVETFAGQMPTILKLNNANGLFPAALPKDQAITASVADAVRLGCAAVGLTVYPGSAASYDMIEQARAILAEARAAGLPTVIWSYPRDGDLSKAGETAVDVAAYAVHLAALLGAHIIKVKLPTEHVEQEGLADLYAQQGIQLATPAERVRHVVQSAFAGRRIVVFSGGAKTDDDSLAAEAQAIRDGGGAGSIIGRNSFQRSREDALKLLDRIIGIYS